MGRHEDWFETLRLVNNPKYATAPPKKRYCLASNPNLPKLIIRKKKPKCDNLLETQLAPQVLGEGCGQLNLLIERNKRQKSKISHLLQEKLKTNKNECLTCPAADPHRIGEPITCAIGHNHAQDLLIEERMAAIALDPRSRMFRQAKKSNEQDLTEINLTPDLQRWLGFNSKTYLGKPQQKKQWTRIDQPKGNPWPAWLKSVWLLR